MRETSRIVIPLIKEIYLKTQLARANLDNCLNLFVQERTQPDQCLLRPYLVHLGYELAGGTDWVDIAPACAALEVFNISTYQANLSFDGKNGILSDRDRNNQFICAMVSAGLAVNALLDLHHGLRNSEVSKIIARLHEVNSDIYVGQFNDTNALNITNLDLYWSEQEYLATYIARCEKLGGSLTSLCFEVGCSLGRGENELLNHLRKIGEILGTAGQMVNDISDLVWIVPHGSHSKGPHFPFSDVKSGKVTFAVFHLLNHGTLREKELFLTALQSGKLPPSSTEEMTRSLIRSGSIKAARTVVLNYYKKLKKEIRSLPKSQARDFLSMAFSSLVTNKYFALLRTVDGTGS